MNLYIGIDIGKSTDVAAFLSTDLLAKHHRYEACPTLSIEQSRTGFETLLATMQRYASLTNCIVLVEHTGHYGRALEQYLQEHDIVVYQVHAQEKPKGSKSDKRDAQALAVLLYNQLERGILLTDKRQQARQLIPPSDTLLLLRGLVQHRLELVRETTRRKNKLIAIADEMFPELVQVYKDLNAPSALALREHFPTPQAVAEASIDALCGTRTHTRPSRKALVGLQELARSTIGTKQPNRKISLLLEQKQLIAELRLLQEHVDVLDEEIENGLQDSREGKILASFPSIGPTWAAVLLAQMGSIANYESASKLRAYMGWSPHQAQSGESQDSMTLTKQGNPVLKFTMYLIVLTAIRTNTPWRVLYRRLVPIKCHYDARTKKYKGKMKVIGRIAGQMIGLIYRLLRKDYDLVQKTTEGTEVPEPELYERGKHRIKGS